jgi:hypothetical protein
LLSRNMKVFLGNNALSILCALFILQVKLVILAMLQFSLLRFKALKVDVLQILLYRIGIF